MIEGRATATCNLGPLIRADMAAADSLQQTGLIKWRGNCEIKGLISPAIGTVVTFTYTMQGEAQRSIPKTFRVLSSFADPLANNGDGQTTVQFGCKLTLMADAREPEEIGVRTDAGLGNDAQADEDFEAIGASISAAYVFQTCADKIGVTYNFNDGALASTFRKDTFDLRAGYVQIMADLLVSESMVGELDASEVLQIRTINTQGGTGTVLDESNLISIAPMGVGQLPGDNVAVQYSSLRMKDPNSEGFNNPWEKTITIGPSYKEMIGYGRQTYGTIFSITFIFPEYEDFMPVVTTTVYYVDVVVGGQTRSLVEREETETVTAKLSDWDSGFTDPGGLYATDTSKTFYQYDADGRIILRETYEEISGWSFERRVGPDTSETEDYPITMTAENTSYQVLVSYDKEDTSYSDGKRKVDRFSYIHKKLTQEGQWQTVWYINRAKIVFGEPDTPPFADEAKLEGLVPRETSTVFTIEPSGLENEAPGKVGRLNSDGQDDLLENTTVTVWVYGDETSIRRTTFNLPYAPDDRVTGTAGNYSVIKSDAETVARNYGRIQNQILYGARYGLQLQASPLDMPSMTFDPVYVDLDGLMGEYRLNNLSYVIDPGEVVCGANALFWGVVGTTPL